MYFGGLYTQSPARRSPLQFICRNDFRFLRFKVLDVFPFRAYNEAAFIGRHAYASIKMGMKTMKIRSKCQEMLLITFATLLVVIGDYFFKFPNHFSTGGVTGLSILLTRLFPGISTSTLVLIINVSLLALGFLLLGKTFGLKTVYASLLLSIGLQVLEWILPLPAPLTDEPFLELIFSVALPALGSAILFNLDASTGGTDIMAMILRKFTRLDIARALFCSDALIVAASCFLFDMKTGLFCILGLIMKSFLVDIVIENINQCKYFTIVCEDPAPICAYIVEQLHRGATTSPAQGAYTHQARTIIFTALGRAQAVQLRRFVRQTDPHAFIFITTTSEIIGKGFRGE